MIKIPAPAKAAAINTGTPFGNEVKCFLYSAYISGIPIWLKRVLLLPTNQQNLPSANQFRPSPAVIVLRFDFLFTPSNLPNAKSAAGIVRSNDFRLRPNHPAIRCRIYFTSYRLVISPLFFSLLSMLSGFRLSRFAISSGPQCSFAICASSASSSGYHGSA